MKKGRSLGISFSLPRYMLGGLESRPGYHNLLQASFATTDKSASQSFRQCEEPVSNPEVPTEARTVPMP